MLMNFYGARLDQAARHVFNLLQGETLPCLGSHLHHHRTVQPAALWKWQPDCFISSAPYSQYPLPAARDEPISHKTSGWGNISVYIYIYIKKVYAWSDLCVQNEDLWDCKTDLSSVSFLLFSGFHGWFSTFHLHSPGFQSVPAPQRGEGKRAGTWCTGALWCSLAAHARRHL